MTSHASQNYLLDLFREPSGETPRVEICGDDYGFLRLRTRPDPNRALCRTITTVDLFCGVGGLSLGLELAAEELGFRVDTRLAVDSDAGAIACFKANFPQAEVKRCLVEKLFESDLAAPLNDSERRLQEEIGSVDLLVGGPPCQGHSDLNNYTRRTDPKNLLYLYMARAAFVLQPKAILIENVVGSLHSRSAVVQQVLGALKSQGFSVDCDFLDFLSVGVPQRRRRVIVVGSRKSCPKIAEIQYKFLRPQRSLEWAIRDLERESCTSFFDSPARPNATTQQRIDYLFDNNVYELPNALRPACHRDKKHSYDTVYGRLRWELPSQTITRGFYCMCMGRYVHPSCRRTLTAHEAARIQFFPDYFDFGPCSSRTKAANLIGNAVPPKGAYVVGLELISSLSST